MTLRPDQLRDPQLADASIDRWFDVTAFGAPAIGRFGTAARGSIESPGLDLWHLGLHKRFRFSDRPGSPAFRIEVTSTNIFNHSARWARAEQLNVTPTQRPAREGISAGRQRRGRDSAGRHAGAAPGPEDGVVMARLLPLTGSTRSATISTYG